MGAAHLTIDLAAVRANWAALDAMSAPGVETAAVVKADAYGLGVAEVGTMFAAAGVTSFFVAIAEEGRVLRRSIGDGPDIYVFSGHMAGDTDMLEEAALIPLLNAPEQVARHFSKSGGQPFGIQLDTGMNRLGMEPADWHALSLELMDAGPRLVMSHLACADEPGHPMNAQQLRVFRELTDGVAHRRSLAATGGILLGPEFHFDLTRPGIGLYGGLPFAEARPTQRVDVPVIQTRQVRPFETVGYGNAWTAKVETTVATVAAGYADGLIRAMGPNAVLYSGETPCPVIGRVSMDLITVDVTALDDTPETLEVIGPNRPVDAVAEAAGTIGYEVLTSLGRRYARTFKDPRMKFLAAIGRAFLGMLAAVGRVALFAFETVSHLFRPPYYPREFASALMQIGYFSLPVVGLTTIFTGGALALQIYAGGARFSAEAVVPQIVAIGMVRELGPVLVGLMIAARVTSSIAAEIATMKVTEQIDALTTLSTNPMKYLTLPRVLAATLVMPVLVGVGDVIGIMGGYLVGVERLGFNAGTYLRNTVDFLEPLDIISSLSKGAVFGFLAALMGCYFGMRSGRGAQGVGRATKSAVVAASVLILAANFILTEVFFAA